VIRSRVARLRGFSQRRTVAWSASWGFAPSKPGAARVLPYDKALTRVFVRNASASLVIRLASEMDREPASTRVGCLRPRLPLRCRGRCVRNGGADRCVRRAVGHQRRLATRRAGV
jgi:hypothetical protein